MRIGLVTAGSRGDAQPMVLLGRELSRRGHEVTVGCSPNLLSFVERCGLRAVPYGPDSQELMESEQGQRWLASGNVRAFMNELSSLSAASYEQMSAALTQVAGESDLLVASILAEDIGLCAAEAAGIGVVVLHSAPFRTNAAYANPMVSTRALPGPVNVLTGKAFEAVWWRGYRGQVRAYRSTHGLPRQRRRTAQLLRDRNVLELQVYSPLVVPGLDLGPRRPLTGFLHPSAELRASLGEDQVDQDLLDWLAEDAPAVYLGLGSMPVSDPEATLRMVTEVGQRLGVRLLVSAGWSDLGAGSRSPQVFAAGAMDHDRVLPLTRAAVHHGGAGTTAASLRAGRPTLVCSVFADQPFWGGQLRRLGVGEHLRFRDLDALRLEAALRRVLSAEVATAAQTLGEQLHEEPEGASTAADLVERELVGRAAPQGRR